MQSGKSVSSASARWWQSHRKDKVEIPQFANVRPSIPWKSLQERAAKVESRRRGTSDWYWSFEKQCIDLGIIHVDNDESLCSSWTKLQWKLGSIQKHKLRRSQELVRYHAEVEIGPTCTNARALFYSDSVFSLVKMSDHSEANRRWENQVAELLQSNSYRELHGIDGEPIEVEWNIFPGLA